MSKLSGKAILGGVLTLLILAGSLIPIRLAAAAAPAASHVTIVFNQQDIPYDAVLNGFRAQLQSLDAATRLSTIRLTQDQTEQSTAIAQLKTEAPDAIFVLGSVALQAVSEEIHDIPIIFGLVVKNGRQTLPDNVTGVYLDYPPETQFYWLRRLLPKTKNIAVIYNPRQNSAFIATAKHDARQFGFRLQPFAITSPKQLPAALEGVANSADLFWGINDQLVVTPQTAKSLLLFSFRNKIPFIGLSDAWVKAGALFALDRDYIDLGRQCAVLTEKVLSGTGVQQLPPESPRRVTYMLNRHTAEQMKLELSTDMIEGAAKIY